MCSSDLRGYGQRDPLQEYKREAFDMFNMLLRQIQQETVQLIFRAEPLITPEQPGFEGELPPELMQMLAEHGITITDAEGNVRTLTPEEIMLHAAALAGDEPEEKDDSSEELRDPHPDEAGETSSVGTIGDTVSEVTGSDAGVSETTGSAGSDTTDSAVPDTTGSENSALSESEGEADVEHIKDGNGAVAGVPQKMDTKSGGKRESQPKKKKK